jgi:1-acyl-sn-glycerol-3-phosphate acyltransferase
MVSTQPFSDKSAFARWVQPPGAKRWGTDPDAYDPDAVQRALDKIGWLFGPPEAWFPTQVSGFENVPDEPCLIVANHSGGTVIPDAWGFVASWYRHFGTRRPLTVLGHDMVFALEATGRPLSKLGVVRADPAIARQMLQQRDVFVMPGGDLETWRPWKDRYRVCFNGRSGYARLAAEVGAPVLPVAHAGAHDTLVVLTDGRAIARKLGFQKLFRASIFPVHLSFPWGLGVGPWPHLPPPTTLRYRLGAPCRPQGREPAAVAALDAEVQAAIQADLDRLRAEDPTLLHRLDEAWSGWSAALTDWS